MQIKTGLMFLALATAGACTMPVEGDDEPSMDGDDPADGDGPSDDDGDGDGDGDGNGTSGGWKQVDLDPGTTARDGNDLIVGMIFTSPTEGIVVTQGANQSAQDGSSIQKIAGDTATVLFDGQDSALDGINNVDMFGISKGPQGYIAYATGGEMMKSADGETFTLLDSGGDFGQEAVLAVTQSASGITMVRDTGAVDITSDAYNSDASWTKIWAPTHLPSVPVVVPADQCQSGPEGTGRPQRASNVYVSPDRGFIAYPTGDDDGIMVLCTSTDGGRSFYPQAMPLPESSEALKVPGVLFTSATTGFVFGGGGQEPYVLRTTDKGETFSPMTLPSSLVKAELNGGYFMPDGMHGWIAGFDFTKLQAFAIETTDGGTTWTNVSGVGTAVDRASGSKLYTVYSPDGETLWLGGDRGVLIHN
jgi:hypothetical protein